MNRLCSTRGGGALLLVLCGSSCPAPAFAQASSAISTSSACPASASYCSARTLFFPPLDGSGTALVGGASAGDGNVLVMGGSASYLPGSHQGPFDIGMIFQHRSGLTVGLGAPFAILPGDSGSPSGAAFVGVRTTAAVAADLKIPVVQPTAGQFGGFSAYALARAQTPGLVAGEARGDSSAFELRALLSFRAFLFALRPTLGVLWQPDRPGDTWRIPFGAALDLHFAPPSWNDDARPRLFVEWLSYGGERWSHAALAGLSFHFRDGSFGFGLGGAALEGNDSFFVRFSFTARARIGDSDGDGVPDDVDLCPHLPEDRDGDRDLDGCPDDDTARRGVPPSAGVCPESGSLAASSKGAQDGLNGAPEGAKGSPEGTKGALVLDAEGLDEISTKRLLAALAPSICLPSFRGFVSSEDARASAAARKVVEDFTGRAGALSIVAPAAFGAVTDAVSRSPATRALDFTGIDASGRSFVIRIRALVDAPERESP